MTIVQYLRVQNFLGLFNLESGGILIGALGVLIAFLQLIAQTVFIASLLFIEDFCPQQQYIDFNFKDSPPENLQDATNWVKESFQNVTNATQENLQDLTYLGQVNFKNETGTKLECSQLDKLPLILVFFFAICFNAVAVIAHYRVIKGIEEMNFRRFLLAIGYYVFMLTVKALTFAVLLILTVFVSIYMLIPTIFFLIMIIIDAYILIVIDTIRYKLEKSPYLVVARSPTTTIETRLFEVPNDDGEAARIIIPKLLD
nr:transmembrane protein LIL12 [Polypedilum vanderplanki]